MLKLKEETHWIGRADIWGFGSHFSSNHDHAYQFLATPKHLTA